MTAIAPGLVRALRRWTASMQAWIQTRLVHQRSEALDRRQSRGPALPAPVRHPTVRGWPIPQTQQIAGEQCIVDGGKQSGRYGAECWQRRSQPERNHALYGDRPINPRRCGR